MPWEDGIGIPYFVIMSGLHYILTFILKVVLKTGKKKHLKMVYLCVFSVSYVTVTINTVLLKPVKKMSKISTLTWRRVFLADNRII